MTSFFDYETVATQAGITPAELGALRQRVRADHPDDDMMAELRLLRTCRAIASGQCTGAEALKPEDDARRAPSLPRQ